MNGRSVMEGESSLIAKVKVRFYVKRKREFEGGRGAAIEGRAYIAIDLKSFHASVECMERGFDPITTDLTILFIIFFGVGYGAYYAAADMPIPMVADCADYETYRSGKYIPGIMGILFSLVDKLVSALGSTVVGIALAVIGIHALPDSTTPYAPGMQWVVVVLFCVLPMLAWIATLIAMRKYSLTGARMKEIQEVNGVRRKAVLEGMSLEESMKRWK